MRSNWRVYRCIIILFTVFGCSGRQTATQPPVVDSVKGTTDNRRDDSGVIALPKKEPDRKQTRVSRAGTWAYRRTVGETGAKLYTASVTSADVLDFAPPFDGGSTVTLTIRKRGSGTTVFLGVSKGQFTSSFQGGKIRVRFDSDPSSIYSFSAASDGATDILFFDEVQPLIYRIKSSRKMIVDAGFYGQGIRKVEFTTVGLKWND